MKLLCRHEPFRVSKAGQMEALAIFFKRGRCCAVEKITPGQAWRMSAGISGQVVASGPGLRSVQRVETFLTAATQRKIGITASLLSLERGIIERLPTV